MEKKWKRKKKDYFNELIFDGEYLNRKKWKGKGKEFNYDDYLLFEGEYLCGKKFKKNILMEDYNIKENVYLKKY